MADIKIFVCCHQADQEVPKHELLYPIQVGAALHEKRFAGFLHDDEGENISRKNGAYCELTAQYWAWKNVKADYYGFFHYRRYLYPDEQTSKLYRVESIPSEEILEKLEYAKFSKLIEKHELIIPKRENMHISVQNHYASSAFHHDKDLQLAKAIVIKHSPEMREAAENYLNGTEQYFGNIYIMKSHIFHQYCEWLFSILEEIDCCSDFSHYTKQEMRVDGYLAERLLGIYVTYQKQYLDVLELPRAHFIPDTGVRIAKRIENAFLPPGSWRRYWVKTHLKPKMGSR